MALRLARTAIIDELITQSMGPLRENIKALNDQGKITSDKGKKEQLLKKETLLYRYESTIIRHLNELKHSDLINSKQVKEIFDECVSETTSTVERLAQLTAAHPVSADKSCLEMVVETFNKIADFLLKLCCCYQPPKLFSKSDFIFNTMMEDLETYRLNLLSHTAAYEDSVSASTPAP